MYFTYLFVFNNPFFWQEKRKGNLTLIISGPPLKMCTMYKTKYFNSLILLFVRPRKLNIAMSARSKI